MKKLLLISICICILPFNIFGSDLFSPIIKIGTNIGRIEEVDGNGYNEYKYPLGFSIGFGNEIKLTDKIYIANTLYYIDRTHKSQIDICAAAIGPWYLKYNSQYLRFSALFGITIYHIADLLIGYDIGWLIDYDMFVYNEWKWRSKFEVDDMPIFDNAVCLGIGRDLRFGRQNFKIEFKYLYGLTEYEFRLDLGNLLGPIINQSLQLELGYRLF